MSKTYVYLMKDLRSGFHKIGFSAKPKYRETTLQAEQPQIELIEAWEGTRERERELHDIFAEKRIRGEWFNLNTYDLLNFPAYVGYDAARLSDGLNQDQLYKPIVTGFE